MIGSVQTGIGSVPTGGETGGTGGGGAVSTAAPVSGDGSGGNPVTIPNGAIADAKLANVTGPTLKGRNSGTGAPQNLTPTQATALLDAFTSGAKGLAPASGGGTANFLRADGTWAAPGGGGGGTVDSVVPGSNIDVDATDPANPIVSLMDDVILAGDIEVGGLVLASGFVDLVNTNGARFPQGLQAFDLSLIDADLDVTGAVAIDGVAGAGGLRVGDGVDDYFLINAGGIFFNPGPPSSPKDLFMYDGAAHFGDVTIAGALNGAVPNTVVATAPISGDGSPSDPVTVDDGAIGNAKLANMATARIKGRTTAGSGAPEDLTGTQATALLDTFTSGAKGLAPASGGGTANFLRADGTWAAPGGGGGGTVDSVVPGSNIDVDATDPANPIVSLMDDVTLPGFLEIEGVAGADGIRVGDGVDDYFLINAGGIFFNPGPPSSPKDLFMYDGTAHFGSITVNETINGAVFPPLNVTDTMGSDGQNLGSTQTFSGTDQDYDISGVIVRPNENVTYTLELNALSSDQFSILGPGVDNVGIDFNGTFTSIFIASAETDGLTGKTYFRGRIVQMAGQERMIYLEVMTFLPGGPYIDSYPVRARWNVTSEITGVRIHASTSTGLKTNSQLRVSRTLP